MTPKKKSIALKFSTFKNKNREKTNSESKIQEESNSESGDEEDMGSLAKKKKSIDILGIRKDQMINKINPLIIKTNQS